MTIPNLTKRLIYVSNYYNWKYVPNPIGISTSAPKDFTGGSYNPLKPTWDLVREYKQGKINEQEYTMEYIKLLWDRKLTPSKVLADLPDPVTLLCYEKIGDFCHRYIAGMWFLQYGFGNITVKEVKQNNYSVFFEDNELNSYVELDLPYSKIDKWFKLI